MPTRIYIFAVLYAKSELTSKYGLEQRPRLLAQIEDADASAPVSVRWNAQGSAIYVLYDDGSVQCYKRRRKF